MSAGRIGVENDDAGNDLEDEQHGGERRVVRWHRSRAAVPAATRSRASSTGSRNRSLDDLAGSATELDSGPSLPSEPPVTKIASDDPSDLSRELDAHREPNAAERDRLDDVAHPLGAARDFDTSMPNARRQEPDRAPEGAAEAERATCPSPTRRRSAPVATCVTNRAPSGTRSRRRPR